MASKPNFEFLSKQYPADDDPAVVRKQIGGSVDADWLENTSAIRLSRALNYSGKLIPAHHDELKTLQGADRLWYAYKIKQLEAYLPVFFGRPEVKARAGPGALGVDREHFRGRRGIIAFDMRVEGAAGHIDLWDGNSFILERTAGRDYFLLARQVVLWQEATSLPQDTVDESVAMQ